MCRRSPACHAPSPRDGHRRSSARSVATSARRPSGASCRASPSNLLDALKGTARRVRAVSPRLTAIGSPRATCRPASTATSTTRPAAGATTTCSIFIASSVTSGSPASTVSPARTWRRRTEPGIGATTSTGPPLPPCATAARAARSTSGGAATRNATDRPARSMWAVSPATTASDVVVHGRIGDRDRALLALRHEPDRRGAVQAPGSRSEALPGRLPGLVRDRGSLGPLVGRPDPLERVDPGLAGRHGRLAHEPAQEAEVRRQAQHASSRRAPRAAARALPTGPRRGPRSSPASGRTGRRRRHRSRRLRRPGSPRRPATRSASTRPVAGRNPASASSA